MWRRLPKVELHLHLEGACPVHFAKEMARRKNVDIKDTCAGDVYAWHGFTGFLRCYDRIADLFSGPEDVAELVTAVLEQSHESGVLYTELFIKDEYAKGDLGAWRELVAAMSDAAAAMEETKGIICRFIPTIVRHRGPDRSELIARFAADVATNKYIVGFGMAGDERMYRPSEFAKAFSIARDAGLSLTCHAGEVEGPDSIRDVIEHLRPDRIGHCVRCVDDAGLVSLLREKEITAEVCPGANISLGLYPDLATHPVREMLRQGLNVTISTDDPPFFGTSMAKEYEMLSDLAVPWDDLSRTVFCGIQAAFCTEHEKALLTNRISSLLSTWKAQKEPTLAGEASARAVR
jgi:adenosine deaminase